MFLFITYLLLFLFSWQLTGWLRQYVLRKKVLDIPNQRSAHTTPMPRGGGLAFVFCFLLMWIIWGWNKQIETTLFWGILSASLLITGLGFCDDRFHLSAKLRLLGHFLAAAVVLYCVGGVKAILPFVSSHYLILATMVALVYLVWVINLFNFMDGIDGIAAIETITVCLGGALLYTLDGAWQGAIFPMLLASAVAGFLIWNFPRAKIFMGDAGSGFLGLMIGAFSLMAAHLHSTLFWGWFILCGVFFCDASMTLLRRLWRRENVFEAHSGHAYQQAARHYRSHKVVSLTVLGINLCWLLPLAVMVQQGFVSGLVGVVIAFAPLVALVLKFDAKNVSRP